MESREVKILNKYGIHARPAAMFVKTAAKFRSNITVEKEEMQVNGKSIMGLLTIEGHHGALLIIKADGPDAVEALDELEALIKQKFNEE